MSNISDLDKERLAAFKAAMTRVRWFLLTSIVIACFMLLHLFTGEYGFQTHQLKQALYRRLLDEPSPWALIDSTGAGAILRLKTGRALNDAVVKLQELKGKQASQSDIDRAARQATELIYARLIANHELSNLSLGTGIVPVLGITTPGNDYVGVMTWLLVVFYTALWLSARSVEAIVKGIEWNNPIRELIRLNVTFTGLVDKTPGARLALFIQYAAVWLPAVLFIAVSILDIVPALIQSFNDRSMIMGEPLYIASRVVLMAFGGLWLVGMAVSNSARVTHIDDWLYSEGRRRGEQGSEARGSEPLPPRGPLHGRPPLAVPAPAPDDGNGGPNA